jgi:hypothetical protein
VRGGSANARDGAAQAMNGVMAATNAPEARGERICIGALYGPRAARAVRAEFRDRSLPSTSSPSIT